MVFPNSSVYRCDAVSFDGVDLSPCNVASESDSEIKRKADDLTRFAHGLNDVWHLVVDAEVPGFRHQLGALEEDGSVTVEHSLCNPADVFSAQNTKEKCDFHPLAGIRQVHSSLTWS